MNRVVFALVAVLLLLSISSITGLIQVVKAESGPIYINADGSISPSTAPIYTADNNTYIFTGNISYPTYDGIIIQRNNVVINGNGYTVQGNETGYGLYSIGTNNVTIESTNFRGFVEGIVLDSSSNDNINGNTFTNDGLHFSFSSQNSVENNTVNGRPLVYLEDTTNYNVADAGQVILIDCNNIKVENLNLSNAGEGVELWDTNNTVISGNNITANKYGSVELEFFCNNDSLTENNVTNSEYGVYLGSSSGNSISRNNIENDSFYGVRLDSCSDNSLNENNIANNGVGILLDDASNNTIYHNDFNNNQVQAWNEGRGNRLLKNSWDDGYPSGGNCWSDYNGTDVQNGPYQNVIGSDGIGDLPYMIDANNTDDYPLMGMYYEFFPSFFSSGNVSVIVISNSTISDLIYSVWLSTPYDGLQGGQQFIEFFTSGQNESVGFCRVSFPTGIMNGTYQVFVNDTEAQYTLLPCSNANVSYLYFTYTQPTNQIIVTIPEFSSLILPLFMAATLLAVIIYKKKAVKTSQT